MKVDYIIVGQGIAGTLLSYELYRSGKRFIVVDNGNDANASLTAAAIINPLAGKHWRLSANGTATIEKAISTYRALEHLLGVEVLHHRPLCIFFKSLEERISFEQQALQASDYLSIISSEDTKLQNFFSDENGIGFVQQVWQVDAERLLTVWRNFLITHSSYLTESFALDRLVVENDFVRYDGIIADKIIFCEGAKAAENPFTSHLPFIKNRGEALLLRIPDLPTDSVYHRDFRLAPFNDNLFWYGSNYKWQFDNLQLDDIWKNDALFSLSTWLKLPYELVEYKVAERPTTAGQKIFAELHPEYKTIAYFNGLGTRGFSAGPTWAHKMLQTLLAENSRHPQ